MIIQDYVETLGNAATMASRSIACATSEVKDTTLALIAEHLDSDRQFIVLANELDLEEAKNNSLDPAMIERLELGPSQIDQMLEGLHQVIGLTDPIGEENDIGRRPSGIYLKKLRVPLGVVGIIYESRPNVTIDAASLCLKAGNACILRGGSEAINSNRAIGVSIQNALAKSKLPNASIQIVNTPDRRVVSALLSLSSCVDIIIPRGGKSLIEKVIKESSIPIIKHLDGNCHMYIDDSANLEMVIALTVNAKTSRYGVCNALESLLIAKNEAKKILPSLCSEMRKRHVELRGCIETRCLVEGIKAASDADWSLEYLAPILSIKIVADILDAIEHINKYGSGHTDCIITENTDNAKRFVREVDSSSVMVNASTRFADGFEYGLGAEIGISTDKIHVRGPVGLQGLTCQKWVVYGDGTIRK
ncbi:MAG: glutamate-5-semialdehyde dehydrogenase [Cellvibrionales bacterium TMED49]|nr:glutamate-5-semialdehyde dehydrogenase [Porticoccaceae bacterium]OUU38281.1 MAG: glutamate-5-semialdehyde dehydrogenase [Cellvibrionales bacterium TMED49]|tara:strand:+ start:224 stop:1480 length:1257 start_codon:yes stop_codon:yes gene_type:complete